MSFTFNTGIPAANNDPSVDQPDMLSNNVSTNAILAVDHVSFNALSGGTHKQITFSSKNTPGALTDPVSVIYTANGTASTVSQLFFKTQNAALPASLIRAYAYCTGLGAIVAAQSVNVTSVIQNSTGVYTVTLTANATTGTNFGVLITTTQGTNAGYTITGANTFQITVLSSVSGAVQNPPFFSFIVVQI